MARINIEDILFEDPRFFDLSVKLGSKETALGALILAWRIAQKHYTKPYKYIPIDVWNKLGLKNQIIESGLATANDRFIRMAGCDEQFAWLKQRVEAGKKGGKNKKNGKNAKSNIVVNSQATANGSQENESDRKASYLLSLNSNTLGSAQIDRIKHEHNPIKQKYVDVLKSLDIEKRFKFKMPEIMEHFESPEALDDFIRRVETTSSKIKDYLENEDEQGAKDYLVICIKKETGIIK